MRNLPFFFAVVVWIVASGCGSAGPKEAGKPEPGKALIAGGEGAQPYEGPPHRFTPRPHPAHRRYQDVPAPNLDSLPKLIKRFGKCYGVTKDKEAKQIAVSGAAPKKKSKKIFKRKSKAPSAKRGGPAATKAPPAAGGAALDMAAPFFAPAPSSAPAGPSAAPAAEMAAEPEARSAAPEKMAIASEDEAPDDMMIAGDADKEEPEELSPYEDWGAEIYLSNDDTMSLSSAQRVIFAIDKFLPLPLEHIRPHELLNYFSFETAGVGAGDDFSVLGDITDDPREQGKYSLALAVKGRPVDLAKRRNAALTLVIDRSGSMHDEGRMSYLKRGLARMVNQLKDGDMVHMIAFDHEVCVPLENFVVGRDKRSDLEKAIDRLRPRGATDLHRGLTRGYEIADRSYQADYSNRVIMITDALTNTGVTDEKMISMVSKYYDTRRIRLSGVGVGRDFNDALLDRLTERGKGAYVFLGSEAEVDAVFGSRFISLIETTSLDVHFLLHLPQSLRMDVFYGEESSTVKEDVQAIHYFANTSQLFLSDVIARGGVLRPQDDVMLTIEYQDPESGDKLFEEYAFNLGKIESRAYNVRKGRLIMAWVDLLAQMAARSLPPGFSGMAGGWEDGEGWQACEDGRGELGRLAEGIRDDREVERVLDLWERYCSRYERPRNPVRRIPVSKQDSWPGAQAPTPR